MTNFKSIVIFIGTAVLVVSFVLAFKLRKKKGLPPYFKFFYWIPLAAILLSINTISSLYFKKFPNFVYYCFQHLFFLVDFSLTCLFFQTIFGRKNKLAAIVFFITITSFGLLLWVNDLNRVLLELHALLCFAIFILCMYYYYKLFDDDEKPIVNLLESPPFWIVTGLFFSAVVGFPLYALYPYLYYKVDYKISSYAISFANIFIIIKHLFFIKAYRCAAKSDVEG
jgi:hypothetical protein